MTRQLVAIAWLLILALVLTTVGCSPESQQAAAAADFYKGKTINLIVSSAAGSRSDLYARIIASYLERDTGASVVVTNKPGAGGLDGMNDLYRSEADGLTLGVVPSVKLVSNKVLDEPAAVYDIEKFSYIMKAGGSPYHVLVSPEGRYQSIADLQAGKDLLLGGASPAGPVSLGGLTVIELLDLDAKVVTGFSTKSDLSLATKRGEIIGYVSSMPSAKAYLDSGLVAPMFVLATERDPDMPDAPAVSELISLSDEDLALVELWGTVLLSSDILAAPPGVPEDRLAFLRDLADEWIQDEGFCEEIDLVSGYEVQQYQTGDVVTDAMFRLATSLDEFRAIFAEMIEKYRA